MNLTKFVKKAAACGAAVIALSGAQVFAQDPTPQEQLLQQVNTEITSLATAAGSATIANISTVAGLGIVVAVFIGAIGFVVYMLTGKKKT